jgi:hypothetical protein
MNFWIASIFLEPKIIPSCSCGAFMNEVLFWSSISVILRRVWKQKMNTLTIIHQPISLPDPNEQISKCYSSSSAAKNN